MNHGTQGTLQRRARGCVLGVTLIIVISAALGYGGLTTGHNWGDDFASYIMQAQSIVERSTGSFAAENRFTVGHSDEKWMCPVAYPWGTPLLLAPIYAAYGLDMVAFKTVGVVLYALFLMSMAIFLWDKHPKTLLLLLIAFFGFNPSMLRFLDQVLSDVPYLFFSSLSVFLIGHVVVEERSICFRFVDRVMMGLAMAAATSTRPGGVLLVVVLTVTHVVKGLESLAARQRRGDLQSGWRGLVLDVVQEVRRLGGVETLPYLVFGGVMLSLRVAFPANEFGTVGGLSLTCILANLDGYARVMGDFYQGIGLGFLIYLATIPLALMGVFQRYRSEYPAIIYVLLTVALYVLYPVSQGLRYLIPVLPFYLHFTFAGISGCNDVFVAPCGRRVRSLAIAVAVAVSVLFLLVSTWRVVVNVRNSRVCMSGPMSQSAREMWTYIRTNTPDNAVIACFKPRAARLFAGRRSLLLNGPDHLAECDYLCARVGRDDGLWSSVTAAPGGQGLLRVVFSNADYVVYRIQKQARDSGAGRDGPG